MKPFSRFTVSKDEALELNLTHEASLYGVAVWCSIHGEDVVVVCKFTPLTYWTDFCDLFIELLLSLAPSEVEYELPLKNVRCIK